MRQKDEMERTENARARSNRHILWLTYGIAALFIAMAVYFGWFIQFKSENVIGSSYNARLDLLSDRVTRGSIMSNDKTVLAQTNVASDGSEKRYYPYDYLFVHSVGYSGKNGKTGLESLANFYLLSSHVNLIEKTINEFQGKKNLGDNVITTLDVDLQQTASDAIGKHRGAVIVMEPDTGKILTMVSQPNFNANLVDERWAELISPDNTKAQLVNRATQGLYPPEKFLAGIEIEKSMKKAKVQLIRQVFEEFQQQMQPILEKYGLELEKDSGYYSYQDSQHDKFYDCYSTYPGLNYVVKKAKFQKAGLELWFRIEVEHNLFAGFCLFDKEARSKDGFSKGYQVDDITDGLKQEASRYLKKEIILPEDWWFGWCYPNGKRHCEETEVPDFKQMNPCAVSLVDETARREYVKRALAVFERELLGWLL